MSEKWSLEAIEKLVDGFDNCTWPCKDWTHEAHLIMGVTLVSRFEGEDVTAIMRERIKRYNVSCGGANTESSGYHETITHFYVLFIGSFLKQFGPDVRLEDKVNKFLADHPDKNLPLEFYSKENLMSVEARMNWVEPDLKAIIQ